MHSISQSRAIRRHRPIRPDDSTSNQSAIDLGLLSDCSIIFSFPLFFLFFLKKNFSRFLHYCLFSYETHAPDWPSPAQFGSRPVESLMVLGGLLSISFMENGVVIWEFFNMLLTTVIYLRLSISPNQKDWNHSGVNTIINPSSLYYTPMRVIAGENLRLRTNHLEPAQLISYIGCTNYDCFH